MLDPPATRRLPGIRFDVAPAPPVEALPRMDVAVLVGFAATGPLHTPVVVESVLQFAAVFGPDAPLAWDPVRGERVSSYLGLAVRAFFSNGGRRCWVIRVARSIRSEALWRGVSEDELRGQPGLATANEFAVGGVLEVPAGSGADLTPARARARCEGSWSDRLRATTALTVEPFVIEDLVSVGSPPQGVTFSTHLPLRVGDLIEIGEGESLSTYLSVDRVQTGPSGRYAVEGRVQAAFERAVESTSPASPAPAWAGSARVAGFGGAVDARLSPQPAPEAPAVLVLEQPVPAKLERGHWARWSDGARTVWLRIDEIERSPVFASSPALDGREIHATVEGPAWRQLDPALPFGQEGWQRARLLTLEVEVRDEQASRVRLSGVGLTPLHDRAWWNNLSDGDLYGARLEEQAPRPAWTTSGDATRFALARRGPATPAAWIPLGASALFGALMGPLPQAASALERDGLARFDAELFLDPELAGASIEVLPELADNIRFVREQGRPLLGLHAAWSVGAGGLFNEASLIAVPDAVHLGWEKRPVEKGRTPRAPSDETPPHWRQHRGGCPPGAKQPLDEPDSGVFLDCATHALLTPVLEGPSGPVPPGAYRLTWTDPEPLGRYVLREATQPDFSDLREIEVGESTEYVAQSRREGLYYYQVYVQFGGERSAASNPVLVEVRADEWEQPPTEQADAALERGWLAIHRAALRMAAAGGELFAVLAMPRHFRARRARRYVERLCAVREQPGSSDQQAFGLNEAPALSYGAMYFPWLESRLRSARSAPGARPELLPAPSATCAPPDGVALGVLAARASSRGAWVAPANELLEDVVALTPVIGEDEWQALQDAQVNLVRAEARGFLTLSADTLAVTPELRPINVRRLLILLRRLALRRGNSFVFEPNGATLRRSVQRSFDLLLTDLFGRGAFSGQTRAEAFRVVTDETINTVPDGEAGRFLVELRVAPAVPLRFISVRLLQSGSRLTVTEEL